MKCARRMYYQVMNIWYYYDEWVVRLTCHNHWSEELIGQARGPVKQCSKFQRVPVAPFIPDFPKFRTGRGVEIMVFGMQRAHGSRWNFEQRCENMLYTRIFANKVWWCLSFGEIRSRVTGSANAVFGVWYMKIFYILPFLGRYITVYRCRLLMGL